MLEQNRDAVASFTSEDLGRLGPALHDLSEAVRSVRDLAEQLRRDPQSLLRGKSEQPRERVAR